PADASAFPSANPSPWLPPVINAEVFWVSILASSITTVHSLCLLIIRLANVLADGYRFGMQDQIASNLGNNIRQLREARGMTQEQMARVSGVPRPTWANMESGAANPTLSIL